MDTAFTPLQAATVVGRAHLARELGSQDAFATGSGHREGRSFSVGVVADGCGSAPWSQVGAALLVAVAARESAALLAAGVPTASLVAPVLAAARRTLLGVASLAGDDLRGFVTTHLLSTLLVLADDGITTTVFGRGDGLVCLDDEVLVLDEDGAPRYLGYDLFEAIPEPFVLTRSAARRALVATDGLPAEAALQAFGHRGRALPRWLNVLAKAAPLADDTTLVVLEREAGAS